MAESEWKPSKWTEATLIPISSDWGFAVGLLEDKTIRIVKGKRSAAKAESGCPVSQTMKLNLKPKDRARWNQIKAKVDELFDQAEAAAEVSQ